MHCDATAKVPAMDVVMMIVKVTPESLTISGNGQAFTRSRVAEPAANAPAARP